MIFGDAGGQLFGRHLHFQVCVFHVASTIDRFSSFVVDQTLTMVSSCHASVFSSLVYPPQMSTTISPSCTTSQRRLLEGLPGTRTRPDSLPCSSPAAVLRSKPPLRVVGLWHRWQRAFNSGCTSRTKSTVSAARAKPFHSKRITHATGSARRNFLIQPQPFASNHITANKPCRTRS